jgi:hypothetical protein
VHIESNEEEQIPKCALDICPGADYACGCEESCTSECCKGYFGYFYDPKKPQMIPPIPLTAMMHYLEMPQDLRDSKVQRARLPKRIDQLKIVAGMNAIEGWGLHFKEKVWETPFDVIKSIVLVVPFAVVGLWLYLTDEVKTLKNLRSLLPASFLFTIFQVFASWLREWAERPIAERAKMG